MKPRISWRRAVTLVSVWAAASFGLWILVRAGFGEADGPARASRAVPGNIAYLAVAPTRLVVRRALGLKGEASIVAAAAGSGAVCVGLVVVGSRWRRRTHVPRTSGPDVGRRVFLVRLGAGGAVLGTAGTVAKATLVDPLDLRIARERVVIDGLPSALDGLRVAHLSDWHVGSRVPLDVLEESTRLARSLDPDLIVLTGDYVHSKESQLPAARAILAPLLAPGVSRFGVVGVLGNHDYYADAESVRATLRELGVVLIDNSRLFLSPGGWTSDPHGALCVAGLADKWMDTPRPDLALGGVPAETPRVVLAHQPDTAELPELTAPGSSRVDLMLCGHTHGGQVRLPLLGTPVIPSRYGQKYAGGRVEGPAFPVVMTRGIGMSVLPVRFGVPPEVGEVTLIRG